MTSNTNKEIFEEMWREFNRMDHLEWLREYVKDHIENSKSYYMQISFNKHHLETILEGLNKL